MSRPKANPTGNPRASVAPAPQKPENILGPAPVPPVPATLGDLGAKLWHEVWTAGGAAYNVQTDVYIVARYCDLHERRRDLNRLVDSEGFTTDGSQGQTIMHPALRALDTTEKELRALEDRLGLNPEARARLGIAAAEAKSKLDAFLET